MTLEAVIERATAAWALRMFNLASVKFAPLHNAGWPDRIFLVPGGRPLFIEFKRPGESLRPLQVHTCQMMKDLGYDVVVCDSIESGRTAVRTAMEAARVPGARGRAHHR